MINDGIVSEFCSLFSVAEVIVRHLKIESRKHEDHLLARFPIDFKVFGV